VAFVFENTSITWSVFRATAELPDSFVYIQWTANILLTRLQHFVSTNFNSASHLGAAAAAVNAHVALKQQRDAIRQSNWRSVPSSHSFQLASTSEPCAVLPAAAVSHSISFTSFVDATIYNVSSLSFNVVHFQVHCG